MATKKKAIEAEVPVPSDLERIKSDTAETAKFERQVYPGEPGWGEKVAEDVAKVHRLLIEPFHPDEIDWRPGSGVQKGFTGRGRALAYIDARAVQDRLDLAFGPSNWNVEFKVLDDKSVVCTMLCHWPDGQMTSKSDRGVESQFEGEKGSFSDAFKRAAVHYGIGRYLYNLGVSWCELKNGFIDKPPKLPDWALPYHMQPGHHDPAKEAATPSRTAELESLIQRTNTNQAQVNAWLFNAQSKTGKPMSKLDDLTDDIIAKCVAFLKAKLAAPKPKDDPEAVAAATRG